MGYSIHDWFEEKALPLLTTCIERIKEQNNEELDDNPSSYELFIQTMKMILEEDSSYEYRKHQFTAELLNVILGDNKETHSKLKTCFDMLTGDEDRQLDQIVYKEGRHVITCDFFVENVEEE
jgi:hypothetical protein